MAEPSDSVLAALDSSDDEGEAAVATLEVAADDGDGGSGDSAEIVNDSPGAVLAVGDDEAGDGDDPFPVAPGEAGAGGDGSEGAAGAVVAPPPPTNPDLAVPHIGKAAAPVLDEEETIQPYTISNNIPVRPVSAAAEGPPPVDLTGPAPGGDVGAPPIPQAPPAHLEGLVDAGLVGMNNRVVHPSLRRKYGGGPVAEPASPVFVPSAPTAGAASIYSAPEYTEAPPPEPDAVDEAPQEESSGLYGWFFSGKIGQMLAPSSASDVLTDLGN